MGSRDDFVPTHVVPDAGMRAWSAPDGSVDPATHLAAGHEVEITQRSGAWAEIRLSDGWTGWVDAATLRPLAPAPPPPPSSPPPPTASHSTHVGAAGTAVTESSPWWNRTRYVIPLVVFAVLAVVGVLVVNNGGGNGAASDQVTLPDGGRTEADIAVVDQVALPGGGLIEIPAGALPENSHPVVESVGHPVLPPGTRPIGEAIRVTTDEPLSLPATIRVPLPDGIDPERLILYRLEEDGTFTLLHTTVTDDKLVAHTLGFSVVGVIESILEEGGPRPPLAIEGPERLSVGALGVYGVPGHPTGVVIEVIGGDVEATPLGSGAAGIQVVPETTGEFYVVARWADPDSGYRAGAVLKVEVDELGEGTGEALLSLRAHVVTANAIVGEPVQVYSIVFYEGPDLAPAVSVRIAYEDGPTMDNIDLGSPEGTYSRGPTKVYFGWQVFLPPHTYRLAGTYDITVTASTGDSSETLTLPVTVRPMEVDLVPVGGVPEVGQPVKFEAIVTGGEGPRAEFTVSPTIPAGSVISGLEATFTFQEAGSHLIKVTITDANDETATDSAYVVITGDPIAITELNGPVSAGIGDPVTVSGHISGGNLIAFGRREGYALTIHWGDGKAPTLMEVPPGDRGANFAANHTYTESSGDGLFDIVVIAATPTLAEAFDGLSIAVTESPGLPEPDALPWTFAGTGTDVTLGSSALGSGTDESTVDIVIVLEADGKAIGTFTFHRGVVLHCGGEEDPQHGSVTFSDRETQVTWEGTHAAGDFTLLPGTPAEVSGTYNADFISGDRLYPQTVPADEECELTFEILSDTDFERIPRQH